MWCNHQLCSKEINGLKARKATQITDIPVEVLKENADIFSAYICDFIKETIKWRYHSCFKKCFKESKENYRLVSILPIISKNFEKIISKQITNFMDLLLSKYQSRFRRGFTAQNCLLAMLEKWKSSVDKWKAFGILLPDLSKTFDCLSHELIVAKLDAYRFSQSVLKLMQSYLSERKKELK